MPRPAWTINSTERTATLQFLGGTLEVTSREADGKLHAIWTGPAEAETKAHHLRAIDAQIAQQADLATASGEESTALPGLQVQRQAIVEGPDVIRRANPELKVELYIHHRESVLEALNNVPGELVDSLRQTHPGFYSRVRASDRPHELDAADTPEPWSIG